MAHPHFLLAIVKRHSFFSFFSWKEEKNKLILQRDGLIVNALTIQNTPRQCSN